MVNRRVLKSPGGLGDFLTSTPVIMATVGFQVGTSVGANAMLIQLAGCSRRVVRNQGDLNLRSFVTTNQRTRHVGLKVLT